MDDSRLPAQDEDLVNIQKLASPGRTLNHEKFRVPVKRDAPGTAA